MGAQGTQHRCFTVVKNEWTNPKNPAGGGFGCELITLKYLYNEYRYHRNIWTTTNQYYELCRYTGGKITLYRHPETDFVFFYDTMPPFYITKYTYMLCHPQQIMQRKHKKFLLSTASKPNGRTKKIIKFKPPKQLSTKWMFQEDFSKFGLVTLVAAACNLRYPTLSCCNENNIITLYYISPDFYKESKWAQNTGSTPYAPFSTISHNLKFYYYDSRNQPKDYTMSNTDVNDYIKSVSYNNGWFNTRILKSYKIEQAGTTYALLPTGVLRYNPEIDKGKGNKMWLASALTGTYNVPRDEDLIFEDYPLWLMLYGYTSFIQQVKKDASYFTAYVLVIKSDALYRVSGIQTTGFYVIVDKDFINGRGPNDTDPNPLPGNLWYPTLRRQLQAINQIVATGQFIPKYQETKNSTWELIYTYNFYFKWGGAQQPEATAADPSTKGKYDVPDKQQERLQIENPDKQRVNTILRTWDYRRGNITKKALKRMYQYLETDESISTDSESSTPPQKKKLLPTLQDPKKENKKISTCLQTLCEESTCPSQEESQNLIHLIQQQHNKQEQLKLNLLTLITDLKQKQRTLLHETGLLF